MVSTFPLWTILQFHLLDDWIWIAIGQMRYRIFEFMECLKIGEGHLENWLFPQKIGGHYLFIHKYLRNFFGITKNPTKLSSIIIQKVFQQKSFFFSFPPILINHFFCPPSSASSPQKILPIQKISYAGNCEDQKAKWF